jgi:hypothetical protein
MSDEILIREIIRQSKIRYGSGVNDGEAFEIFTAESILKRFGLTFDQVTAGIVDGKNDGGIDSAYFFVNRSLVASDSDLSHFKNPVEVDLFVVQSKSESGFTETAMAHLTASIPDLIKLDAKPADLAKRYNNDVCTIFETYRAGLKNLAVQFPTVRVHVIYCTLAPGKNVKVEQMIAGLETAVSSAYPKSVCKADLWGASRLYEEAKKQNVLTKKLPFVKLAISHGDGYVCLTRLQDYYDFITDNGELVDALFEFNVRDYQSGASVNKEIAETLNMTGDTADFWWLNNGVTMLAEQAGAHNNELTVRNPIVVNGLQTSHEIYRFVSSKQSAGLDRCVQIRVLQIEDEIRRDRVIKATNSQTSIRPASLHATEPFQRKVEDYLSGNGIFYDRRKDYWRNKGKPADRIIGIDKLAQAVMAIVLQRPHDARARPTTILRDDELYPKMFSAEVPLEVYKFCAELHFAVDAYLKAHKTTIEAIYRNNLRYHLMMQLSWRLNGSWPIHAMRYKTLDVSTLTDTQIKTELDHTIKLFKKAGPTDRVAKDLSFTNVLKTESLVKKSSLAGKSKPKKAAKTAKKKKK